MGTLRKCDYMKDQIRQYILERRKYLNLASLCREVGIPKQSISLFLQGHDGQIELDKLLALEKLIRSIS